MKIGKETAVIQVTDNSFVIWATNMVPKHVNGTEAEAKKAIAEYEEERKRQVLLHGEIDDWDRR